MPPTLVSLHSLLAPFACCSGRWPMQMLFQTRTQNMLFLSVLTFSGGISLVHQLR